MLSLLFLFFCHLEFFLPFCLLSFPPPCHKNASSSPYNVEVVSGWLRTNPHAREVLLQEISGSKVIDRPKTATCHQLENQQTKVHLMNVVLPVEYCPISITNGFPSKSGSSSIGECMSWYLYSCRKYLAQKFTL